MSDFQNEGTVCSVEVKRNVALCKFYSEQQFVVIFNALVQI